MRAMLARLTTRGKTFLAVGAAAAVVGLIFGERNLFRIGALLLMASRCCPR